MNLARGEGAGATPWTGAVLAALMGLAALSAFLWPLGFTLFVPLAGLLCLPALRPGRPEPALLALAALTGLAMMAAAWSPVPFGLGGARGYADLERQTWGKLALQLALYLPVVAAAARLSSKATTRAARVFAWAAVALAVVVLLEGLSGAGGYQALRQAIDDPIRPDLARKNVAQASYALALIYWPAALWLRRAHRRVALALLTAGAWLGPVLLSAMAPAAALAASGLVLLVVTRAPRRGPLLVGAGLALAVLALPWLLLAVGPVLEGLKASLGASWAARIDIWLFAAERAAERPWLGWGLDASRTFGAAIPLHPHSAPLQLWLELGLAGAALAAAFWALLLRRIGRGAEGDPGAAGQAAAAAAAYFVIGALSFGVWQEWWLALGALAAVWATLAARAPDPFDETVIEA